MSSSSTTSPTTSNSPLPSNNQTPIFLLSNISTYVTVKLDHNNFLTWKFQITHILEAYSLLEYVEGYSTCPQKFLIGELGAITTQINPIYSQWQARDKVLMSLISATLSLLHTPWSLVSPLLMECGLFFSKGILLSLAQTS